MSIAPLLAAAGAGNFTLTLAGPSSNISAELTTGGAILPTGDYRGLSLWEVRADNSNSDFMVELLGDEVAQNFFIQAQVQKGDGTFVLLPTASVALFEHSNVVGTPSSVWHWSMTPNSIWVVGDVGQARLLTLT